jgi:TetR/AcrR family transcriptional regulator, mexJK operon transcriptional repressor
MAQASQAERDRPRAGRPSRAQAEARQAALLDHALDMFLDRGFEQTTVESVAAAVGMTKRTIYARYPDKAALFKATVQRAIARSIVPRARYDALDQGNLSATLMAFARMRVADVQSPQGLKLQRIVNTESFRFPEIFGWYFEQAAESAISFLTDLLRRYESAGAICVGDPAMAANMFMSMAVGGPVRMIVSGNPLSNAAINDRIAYAVRLFLDGAWPRGNGNDG